MGGATPSIKARLIACFATSDGAAGILRPEMPATIFQGTQEREFVVMRIGFGLLAALMLATAVAVAQPPPPAPSKMQIAEACGADIDRLCPGVPPGQGRIKACMKAHFSQLSAPCFDTLMAAAASKKEP